MSNSSSPISDVGAEPDPAGRSKPARVLVVDDTDANRYALSRILSTGGFEVIEAATGTEALQRAAADSPDVVVLDVKLPDIDGYEVCRRLKGDRKTSHVPVLQISASFVRPEDQAHGLDGGADAYLVQPVEREVLIAWVKAMLRVRRAETGLREAKEHAERCAKEAEEANSAKDQFLAALSHELRTPLTPVFTTIQLLQSRQNELTPDVRDAITIIRRNIELEARLIDDLLDLTRVAKGKVELVTQTIDVHELIANVIHTCSTDSVSKGQSLVVELRAKRHHVHGDPARIQQILWNLCKNAVKFTPLRGTVTVQTENPDEKHLTLRVVDTGVGIEPHMLPKIFNAFEQGDRSVTRQFGGLGLGLAISRALTELHGGTLIAESEGKDKGATFTLTLELAPEPEAAKKPAPADRPATSGGLRILLVEDHEDSSRAMARVLHGMGYRVTTAPTVGTALETAHRDPFDLIISDIGLPDGSGLDLMKQLRIRFPRLSGIALSGYGMDEDRRRCAEAGFAAHLTKPVNLQQLDTTIRQLVAKG